MATFQKDRALDEVFRRPFRDETMRNTQKSQERRKASNVVNHWMQNMGPDGTASPPVEQDRSIVDRLEARRLSHRRSQLIRRHRTGQGRDFSETGMSVASDPEDFVARDSFTRPLRPRPRLDSELPNMSMDDLPEQSAADADDEFVGNEEDKSSDRLTMTTPEAKQNEESDEEEEDYFHQTPTLENRMTQISKPRSRRDNTSGHTQPSIIRSNAQPSDQPSHGRNISITTVLHDPVGVNDFSSSPDQRPITARNSGRNTRVGSGANTPVPLGKRSPKQKALAASRPRPIMPPRTAFQSAPNLAGMLMLDTKRGRKSSLTMDLGSDLGDNKAVGGGFVGIPSSLATQMAFATEAMKARQDAAGGQEDQRMMSRLMLARMSTLEEGFREVLKEVKDWRKDVAPKPQSEAGGLKRIKSKKEGNGKAKSEEGGPQPENFILASAVPKEEQEKEELSRSED